MFRPKQLCLFHIFNLYIKKTVKVKESILKRPMFTNHYEYINKKSTFNYFHVNLKYNSNNSYPDDKSVILIN